ncbi:uncharacterized protein [Montipora foliosa]|uniref:uncharacterized protein n=1 Tax=Montipora foliosa TaxID=591990 RepID=UPI0035F1B21D
MAATLLVALTFMVFFTCFFTCPAISGATYADESQCFKHNAYSCVIREGIGTFCAFGFYARVPVRLELSLHVFHKSGLPCCLWTTRGYTCLLVPGHDPPQDITIFMDVSLNPGPDLTGSWIQLDQFTTSKVVGRQSHTNSPSSNIKYSRKFLLSLRSSACTPCPQVLGELKSHGVLKYRGGKGGKKTRGNYLNIFPTTTERDYANFGYLQAPLPFRSVNLNNLISVTTTNSSKINCRCVQFCVLNVRSIKNKTMAVKDFVVDQDIDILALTETWLRPGNIDNVEIRTLCPTGYRFLHVPTDHSRGGGVGLLFKDTLQINSHITDTFKIFELMDIHFRTLQFIRVLLIYRPPDNSSTMLFLEEFSLLLEQIMAESTGHLLICGDFNVHVDDPCIIYANRFNEILESCNLKQLVTGAAHSNGHTLDLVISKRDDHLITGIKIIDSVISDHCAVHCNLRVLKPHFMKKKVYYRKLCSLDTESFCEDISTSPLLRDQAVELNALVDQYDNVLGSLLGLYAPLKQRTVTLRPGAPWYKPEVGEQKNIRRRKIDKIHHGLVERKIRIGSSPSDVTVCGAEFCNFAEVTQEEIKTFSRKSLSKSCEFDPLPAVVLKGCFIVLLPTITRIINLSLSTGVIPDALKVAILSPMLKKSDADFEQFQNFRPISNLKVVSKLVEKAVAIQLTDHVMSHHLDETFQSAYKNFHSTETALVRVQNDILCAIDNNESVILLLLDLSAAFDTVDHSIMLSRLRDRFGVNGTVLAWFESYLTSWKQFVQVNGCRSTQRSLERGVPQGSVLGPLLYLLYTSPVANIINFHKLQYHLYADDTQLYISFKTDCCDDLSLAKHRV